MAMEHEASGKAMKLLEAFSNVANRGDLHPSDLYRWRAFIIQVHLDDALIPEGLVTEWFEDKGWSHDKAVAFGADYYESRNLLKEYDEVK